jgi:Icc-related predicted phosphoesterase
MYNQYQGDVDDGLHMHFIGSDILLGHVVVVSGDIRFKGILTQSADRLFQHQKNEVVNLLWE